jgi:hypothetical protein
MWEWWAFFTMMALGFLIALRATVRSRRLAASKRARGFLEPRTAAEGPRSLPERPDSERDGGRRAAAPGTGKGVDARPGGGDGAPDGGADDDHASRN